MLASKESSETVAPIDPDDDGIPVDESEELLTLETVKEMMDKQRVQFSRRIGIALASQRTKLLTMAANETRRILKERNL